MERKTKKTHVTKKTSTKKTVPVSKIKEIKKEAEIKIDKVKKQKIKEVERVKEELVNIEKKKDSAIKRLKKEIKESEKVLNNEKNIRKTGITLFVVFCLVVMVLSIALIDYSNASLKEKTPIFVIERVDKEKQITFYYGLFYKAWRCNNETSLTFATYPTKESVCTYEITYVDGYYTNPYGVKMTQKQVVTIYKYYSDYINTWKTEEELNNACALANEFNSIWWVKKEVNIPLNNGTNAAVAVFSGISEENGVYSWNIEYNNENYHKCVVQGDDGKYLFSDYRNNQCIGEFKKLNVSENFCKLVSNDESFIKNVVTISKICE